jgi:predicted Zn finger-like uncharacterized protein
MILTCPNCGTQYVVKDGAIPPGGRQVRCASCKHSWHQDSEESEGVQDEAEPAPPPSAEPSEDTNAATDEADDSFAEASLIEPRSGPEAEERAYEEAVIEGDAEPVPESLDAEPDRGAETYAAAQFDIQRHEAEAAAAEDWREPPGLEAQDDEFSPFPAANQVAPQRRRPILGLLLIVIAIAVVAAAFWFLAPTEWKAQLGLAAGASPLELVTTHMDRQRLESGNDLLTVTGRVINPTGKAQDVPPLQAQLKDRTGKVVYSWTIQPPAQSLAPGGSASFNSAEVSVPPGGEELTISLGSSAS